MAAAFARRWVRRSAPPPSPGTKATLRICDGSSRQQFGYTSDLYLKLINSESSTAAFGMCLDAGATHASGNWTRRRRSTNPPR